MTLKTPSIDIYSTSDCKYCTMAKSLLNSFNKVYNEYKLDRDLTLEEIKEKFPNARSFPIVVLNDEYIGGYEQLKIKIQQI